jgi:hypothetical protein
MAEKENGSEPTLRQTWSGTAEHLGLALTYVRWAIIGHYRRKKTD